MKTAAISPKVWNGLDAAKNPFAAQSTPREIAHQAHHHPFNWRKPSVVYDLDATRPVTEALAEVGKLLRIGVTSGIERHRPGFQKDQRVGSSLVWFLSSLLTAGGASDIEVNLKTTLR